jgi:antitoxin component YwqK of YwqJK toxin-antitoxin module
MDIFGLFIILIMYYWIILIISLFIIGLVIILGIYIKPLLLLYCEIITMDDQFKNKIQYGEVFGYKYGDYKEWYSNGNLKIYCNYGLFEIFWFYNEYYNSKKKCVKIKYNIFGAYKEWYRNGNLKSHGSNTISINNKFYHIGLLKEWYSDGMISKQSNYNNLLKLHGKYEEWHNNGLLQKQSNYINGVEQYHEISYFNFDTNEPMIYDELADYLKIYFDNKVFTYDHDKRELLEQTKKGKPIIQIWHNNTNESYQSYVLRENYRYIKYLDVYIKDHLTDQDHLNKDVSKEILLDQFIINLKKSRSEILFPIFEKYTNIIRNIVPLYYELPPELRMIVLYNLAYH